ncbi:Clavaminate synthase-like protein [Penicillium longicatenatum]|uniref:Clavaminate synthase-like protein n=1 Tax=Penicillium longicatenatum TaxID=1561947 RepID=UPI00254871ED|nr:Clavaminate synthase-like protein [Penicillium longicatenatum]KAJ5658106.1 Clavaminate synthase-like protein [Penicillium longicatenatum]
MLALRLLHRRLSWTVPRKASQRTFASVPQLFAGDFGVSKNTEHVRQVNRHLKDSGIVKINLQFEDDHCSYLKQLLLQLHKDHDHGLPTTHSASRGWLWDVRPQPDPPTDAYIARSETMYEFPWHTDCSYENSPARYFALQVVQPDKCGGGTLSVLDTSRLLSLMSPSVLETLGQPEFRINVPPEFIKEEKKTHIIGNLLQVDEKLRTTQLRFREDIITPLTEPAQAAFEELQLALASDVIQSQVVRLTSSLLPRGSIIAMDNHRWLHGRDEVLDPNRYLRRVRWDARPFNNL